MIRLSGLLGWDVVEVHEPFWERFQNKVQLRDTGSMLLLALQLAVTYVRLLTRYLLALRTANVVMVGYIGQLDMLLLAPLARLRGIPVVFNPLVTLTDTVVEDREMVRPGSTAARLIGGTDRLSLKLASHVIVDTDQNGDYIYRRFRVPRHQITTVFVGSDEEVFRRQYREGSRGHLHVLFYGKMIPLHGVETILNAAAQLYTSGDTDICFEIIGSGQQDYLVRQFIESNPTVPMVHRPWVAYPRLAQRIACADVTLGVFGTGDKAARVIPNKVFQSMAVGAPIITRDSAAVRAVLEDRISALLIPPGDSDALAAAIRELRNPELRVSLGRRARLAFDEHGRDDATARQLQSVFDRMPTVLYPDNGRG